MTSVSDNRDEESNGRAADREMRSPVIDDTCVNLIHISEEKPK